MRSLLRVIISTPLLFASMVYSQTDGSIRPSRPTNDGFSQGAIRGSVVLPDGSPMSQAVRVTLKVMRGDRAMAYTDQQGLFEFNNITPGQYTVEIEPDRGSRFEIASEKVLVQRGQTFVTISLKEKSGERQMRSATDNAISVAMLNQKVPSAARKEFNNASRLAREGKAAESILALRRAVAIYPDYLEARNDLGAQLLEQGHLDEASKELAAALKIDPKAFNPTLNLGIVQVRQNNFTEGLGTLEKALSLDSTSPTAHLYVGIAAVHLGDSSRGVKELQAAYDLGGSSYAIALFHLGQLYMKLGERELARKSFEEYLRHTPDAVNADQVQKLISVLR